MEGLRGIFKQSGGIKVRRKGLKKGSKKEKSPLKDPMIKAALGTFKRDSIFHRGNINEKDNEESQSPENNSYRDSSPSKYRMRNIQIKNFKPELFVREGITKEEVIEFKAAFDLFDADGGGTIDPNEMIDAMKDLAVPMQKDTIIEFFKRKGQNDAQMGLVQSNEITFDEMINMMTISNKDETREELEEVFKMFDVRNQGFIDLESLQFVAKQMGEIVQEGDLEQMIAKADRTGNGKIYFEDFYYLIKYVD